MAYSCEDLYQNLIHKTSGNSFIYSIIQCKDKYSLYGMALRLKNFSFDWFGESERGIFSNEIIEEVDTDTFYSLTNGENIESVGSALKMYYSQEESKILIFFDHRYLGGTFFAKATACMIGAEQIKFPNTSEISIFKKIYSLMKFVFCDLLRIKFMEQSVKLAPVEIPLRRVQWNFSVPEECDCKRIFVMHNNLKEIFSRLPLDVNSLNIMIPVAFEQKHGVYNNIGAIFVQINRRDCLNDIYWKVVDSNYHALATNLISNMGFKGGDDIRKKIDVIMTMFYAKNGKVDIEDAMVSYFNKALYPLYCMSITYNNKVFTTLTINSDILIGNLRDKCDINKRQVAESSEGFQSSLSLDSFDKDFFQDS